MSLHERINKTLLLGQSYPGMAAMPGMVWGLPTLPASSLPPSHSYKPFSAPSIGKKPHSDHRGDIKNS